MAKNNETTTKFKVDISDLKKSMQEAKKQVAYANSDFKAVSSSMDDWSKSSDGISAKLKQLNSNLKSQENILNEYEKTLEEVKKEYGENSKEALDYATKLNNQQAVVNKIKSEIAGYEDALTQVSKAEKIASKTGKDVADVLDELADEAKKAGDSASESSGGFTVLKGALADLVADGIRVTIEAFKELVTDSSDAFAQFRASTGLAVDAMGEYEDAIKSVYKNNFGESLTDVAEKMAKVKEVTGELDASKLQDMTEKAITLEDVFGMDMTETLRGVQSLVNHFGISSEEAFDLMATGAQNGLNYTDELGDNVAEYAGKFAEAGFSADRYFQLLQNGSDGGAYNLDKVNDAINEVTTRLADGTIEDAMNLFDEDVQFYFDLWKNGEATQKEVIDEITRNIQETTNEQEKMNLAATAFGTMAEDGGTKFIESLNSLGTSYNDVTGKAEELASIKYDTPMSALQGIGRSIKVDLLDPLVQNLMPTISDLATKFSEWLNDPATQDGIKNLTDSVTEFVDNGLVAIKDFVVWFLANKDAVIAGLAGIATGFLAFKVVTLIQGVVSAMQGMTVAQYALNLAMSLNPIGIIIALIAGLVAAFVVLWNKSDTFREFWLNLWEGIKNTVSVAKDWIGQKIEAIGKFFTETLPNFFSGLIEWIKANWQSLLLMLINPFAGLFKYFYDNNGKFKEFVDNAIIYIKELPSKVWTWLVNTINNVITWRNDMIAKAGEMALSFINKVIEFVKQLPEKIWTWLTNVITKVVTWGTNLASKGKEAGQKLMDSLIEKVKEIPDKMLSIGSDIVKGLWNGISDATQWLKDKISGFVGDVTGWLKEKFEIGSPSKLMAREIGKWLPAGVAVGIDDNAKTVMDSMKNLAIDTVGSARAGLQRATTTLGSNGVVTGGVVNNFYQTINSPKQLSRLDIYRQSKNLLRYAGGGF